MTKTRVRFDSDTNFSHFMEHLETAEPRGTIAVDHAKLTVDFYNGMDEDTETAMQALSGRSEELQVQTKL